jgi:RNA polymerase-binding transcription factor DksA
MTPQELNHYRDRLQALARRERETYDALEGAARTPTGGEAAGGLSNAPMHLGDVGSEVYQQELNATLLENELFIAHEVSDALGRIDSGTFGTYEECGKSIPERRLEALPYARYCVACAEELNAGVDVNLNRGRPAGWGSTFEHPAALAARRREGEQSPTTAPRLRELETPAADTPAAGTPGGGTGGGGLAGTNAEAGDPDSDALEEAMGSGEFDVADESDQP